MPPTQDGLEQLVAPHCRFLAQASMIVARDMGQPKTASYRELLALLAQRMSAHEAWLLGTTHSHSSRAGSNEMKHAGIEPPIWGPIVVGTRTTKDDGSGIVLQVDGPADGDMHTVVVETEQAVTAVEADIKQYSAMSEALARAAHQAVLARDLQGKSFTAEPSSPGRATADTDRIALLSEYNDLRDIAQQLIGILADNRGVPVRSLYADGRFGVGVDD